jgi:hypothetical protein
VGEDGMNISNPNDQQLTICVQCANYIRLNFVENRFCAKAKLLSINTVTGLGSWEQNETKNDGNCPDFERQPDYGPVNVDERRLATLERVKTALEILRTGKDGMTAGKDATIAALRAELGRAYEALRRHRQGMLNILEFRKLNSGRYGALTREEIEETISEIDSVLSQHSTAVQPSDVERKARAFDLVVNNGMRVMHWPDLGYRVENSECIKWFPSAVEAVEAAMQSTQGERE